VVHWLLFYLASHRQYKCIFAGEDKMNAVKMFAIVLIVAGALGLAYGGFTYTKETHQAKLGPIELSVKDTETVNVPVWVGVGAIVAGMILLFARK
jgi:TRAP-type C4-dicarboxylate transport system permease small subunit